MRILPFRRAQRQQPESRLAALTRRVGAVQELRDYATTPWSRKFLTLVEWELKQRMTETAYEICQQERAA